jgi:hypothetical protein
VHAKQVLYHLSYPPALFSFSYFSDGVSCFCPRLAADCNLPTYGLPCSWHLSHVPPYLAYWFEMEISLTLHKLASNHDLPNLCVSVVAGISGMCHHT